MWLLQTFGFVRNLWRWFVTLGVVQKQRRTFQAFSRGKRVGKYKVIFERSISSGLNKQTIRPLPTRAAAFFIVYFSFHSRMASWISAFTWGSEISSTVEKVCKPTRKLKPPSVLVLMRMSRLAMSGRSLIRCCTRA